MPLSQADGNWEKASEGWPEIKEEAYGKYVFNNMSKILPYGSVCYLMEEGILRIEREEQLKFLEDNYRIAKDAILRENAVSCGVFLYADPHLCQHKKYRSQCHLCGGRKNYLTS